MHLASRKAHKADDVAVLLNISARTLHRPLKEAGLKTACLR